MQNKHINYAKVSDTLTGKKGVIRANYIPKKFKKQVSELESIVKKWEFNIKNK